MQEDGKRRANPSYPYTRRDPRALVCARALVKAKGEPPTEHLTYDLSAGGVRLCGLPRARVGDRVALLLHLPGAWVPAVAQLLRVSRDGRPDCALQFTELEAAGEDTIQDAVLEALGHSERRSVLLLRGDRERHGCGWEWLDPVSALCTAAATPLEAMQRLACHDISLALLGEQSATQIADWRDALPELTWRFLDREGRLCTSAPRGVRPLH